jgi:hypothetical protein
MTLGEEEDKNLCPYPVLVFDRRPAWGGCNLSQNTYSTVTEALTAQGLPRGPMLLPAPKLLNLEFRSSALAMGTCG